MSGLSELTKRLLASERERLNAIHARSGGRLETEEVFRFVRATIDPLLTSLSPEPSGETLVGLFEVGLLAMQRGLVGKSAPTAFERTWARCLPRFGSLVVDHPRELVRRLGNAFARLERELGDDAAVRWIEALASVGTEPRSIDELSELGLVVAWSVGLAEARAAALEVVDRLPFHVRTTLLGGVAVDPDPLARFCRVGRSRPLGPLAELGSVGGFLGFGGPFRRPPLLVATTAGIVASSAGRAFVLHADAYGRRVLPYTQAWTARSTDPQPTLGPGGAIEWRGHRIADPRYASALSVVAHDGVLALSLRDSHRIILIGHREGI